MAWTLAQAKEHLEEIVERAEVDGPQLIEIGGEAKGVIVTVDQWTVGRAQPLTAADLVGEGETDTADFKTLLRRLGSALNGEDLERYPEPDRSS